VKKLTGGHASPATGARHSSCVPGLPKTWPSRQATWSLPMISASGCGAGDGAGLCFREAQRAMLQGFRRAAALRRPPGSPWQRAGQGAPGVRDGRARSRRGSAVASSSGGLVARIARRPYRARGRRRFSCWPYRVALTSIPEDNIMRALCRDPLLSTVRSLAVRRASLQGEVPASRR
jgi:hypothetical protein